MKPGKEQKLPTMKARLEQQKQQMAKKRELGERNKSIANMFVTWPTALERMLRHE